MEQPNQKFEDQSKLSQTSTYLLGLAEVKAHTFEQQILMLLNSKHNFNELKKSLKAQNYIIDHLESVFSQAKLSRTFIIVKKLSQSITTMCNYLIQALEKQSIGLVETLNKQSVIKAQQPEFKELHKTQRIIEKSKLTKANRMGGIHIYNESYHRKLQKQTLLKNQIDKLKKKQTGNEQINQQNFKTKLFQKMKSQLSQLEQQIHFPIPDQISNFIVFERKFLQTFNHCSYAQDIQNMVTYLDSSNSNAIQFLKSTEDMGEQISKFKVQIQALINDTKNKNKLRNQNLEQKFQSIIEKFMGNRIAIFQKTTQKLNQYKKMLKQKQENRVSVATETHTKQLTEIKVYQKKLSDLQGRLKYREQQAQKSYRALLLKAENEILALQSQLTKSKIYQKALTQQSNQLKEQIKKLISQLCAKPQQVTQTIKITKGKSNKKIILNKTKKNIQSNIQLQKKEKKRKSVHKKSIRLSSFQKDTSLSYQNKQVQNSQSIAQQLQQITRRQKQTQKEIQNQQQTNSEKQIQYSISTLMQNQISEKHLKSQKKHDQKVKKQTHEKQQKKKKIKIQQSFKELKSIQNILDNDDNRISGRQNKRAQKNQTQKSIKRIRSTNKLPKEQLIHNQNNKFNLINSNQIQNSTKLQSNYIININNKQNANNDFDKIIESYLGDGQLQTKMQQRTIIQQLINESIINENNLAKNKKNKLKKGFLSQITKQDDKYKLRQIQKKKYSQEYNQNNKNQQQFSTIQQSQIRKIRNQKNKTNPHQYYKNTQNREKYESQHKKSSFETLKRKQKKKIGKKQNQKQEDQAYTYNFVQNDGINKQESDLTYIQAYSICLTNGNCLVDQGNKSDDNINCNNYAMSRKKNKKGLLQIMKNKANSAHQQTSDESKLADKSHISIHNMSQMCHSWRYKQQISETNRFNRETIGTINQQKQRSLSTDQDVLQLSDFILKIKGLMKKDYNFINAYESKKQFVRRMLQDKIKSQKKLNKYGFKVTEQNYDPVILQIRTRSIEKDKLKKIYKKRQEIKQIFARTKKMIKQEQREHALLPSINIKSMI